MAHYTYDQNGRAYQLKGGKHSCPYCGQRTLQLYIAVDNGNPINDQVGKCDRHYNCGYDYKPRTYYTDHPLELPPSKDGKRRYMLEPKQTVIPIDKSYVERTLIPTATEGMTVFTDYLLRLFPADRVKQAIDTFYLGRTKSKAVIFWQIDEKGIVREGKVMKYQPTGNRDKASWVVGESFWIFSTLQSKGELPAKDGEKEIKSAKCIFGQHQLRNAGRDTRVFIVEGEKNAVIGSLMMPGGLWLAVGSSEEIGKVWKVKNILSQCRSVVFVPDADAIKDWREQVEHFDLPNAAVSNFCAGHAGGYDLADYAYYRCWEQPNAFKAPQQENGSSEVAATEPATSNVVHADNIKTLQVMIDENPAIRQLVDKFGLEIAAGNR